MQCAKRRKQLLTLNQGPNLQINLRKNPKFSISFSKVYLKFILSYNCNIFIDFYM